MEQKKEEVAYLQYIPQVSSGTDHDRNNLTYYIQK